MLESAYRGPIFNHIYLFLYPHYMIYCRQSLKFIKCMCKLSFNGNLPSSNNTKNKFMNTKEQCGTKHCLNLQKSKKSSIKFCKSLHFCSGGWKLVLFTFHKNLVISAKCWEKCFKLTNDNSVKRLTRNCAYSAGPCFIKGRTLSVTHNF